MANELSWLNPKNPTSFQQHATPEKLQDIVTIGRKKYRKAFRKLLNNPKAYDTILQPLLNLVKEELKTASKDKTYLSKPIAFLIENISNPDTFINDALNNFENTNPRIDQAFSNTVIKVKHLKRDYARIKNRTVARIGTKLKVEDARKLTAPSKIANRLRKFVNKLIRLFKGKKYTYRVMDRSTYEADKKAIFKKDAKKLAERERNLSRENIKDFEKQATRRERAKQRRIHRLVEKHDRENTFVFAEPEEGTTGDQASLIEGVSPIRNSGPANVNSFLQGPQGQNPDGASTSRQSRPQFSPVENPHSLPNEASTSRQSRPQLSPVTDPNSPPQKPQGQNLNGAPREGSFSPVENPLLLAEIFSASSSKEENKQGNEDNANKRNRQAMQMDLN